MVALERPVRYQPRRCALGRNLLRGLTKRQRLGLREQVSHQQVVMATNRVESLAETDKIGRNQLGTLVYQLVERMLAVGARLAPVDRPSLIIHAPAVKRHRLAVA